MKELKVSAVFCICFGLTQAGHVRLSVAGGQESSAVGLAGYQAAQEVARGQQYLVFLLLVALVLLSVVLAASLRRLSRLKKKLKIKEERLRISAVVFETQDAILITDADETIIRVNPSFKSITGYTDREVLGKTPRILSSGRHDTELYTRIWKEIQTFGGWTGELWNRRKNGEIFPVRQVITAIRNEAGEVTHYLSNFCDITQQKLSEEQIHQLAFYDPLTGLANRRLLEDHIIQAFFSSARDGSYCALLFIDLDHFKHLNDTMGHKQGDELLKMVATRLKWSVREGDTVARQGGDEFIILLEGLGAEQAQAARNAQHIAEKVLDAISQPYMLSENQYVVTASIGISLFIDHDTSVEDLMKHSDLAMYQVKADGRSGIRFYDASMQKAAIKRGQLEADLRKAVDLQQFELHLQPKFQADGRLHGYEALLRWRHPDKGLMLPMEFIALAEDTGLIVLMGLWVFRQACVILEGWQHDEEKKDLVLAINISPRQFRQKNFVDSFIAHFEDFNFPPQRLQLEITESLLMDDMAATVEKMKQLSAVGFSFALDDFGTGFSSLSYLKNLPLYCLKIDRSFVRDMLEDSDDAAIVETIISLGKTLSLQVTAEGVENEQQVHALRALGCDLMQGYYFGRPVPLDRL